MRNVDHNMYNIIHLGKNHVKLILTSEIDKIYIGTANQYVISV